jgi:hypothetical protein
VIDKVFFPQDLFEFEELRFNGLVVGDLKLEFAYFGGELFVLLFGLLVLLKNLMELGELEF